MARRLQLPDALRCRLQACAAAEADRLQGQPHRVQHARGVPLPAFNSRRRAELPLHRHSGALMCQLMHLASDCWPSFSVLLATASRLCFLNGLTVGLSPPLRRLVWSARCATAAAMTRWRRAGSWVLRSSLARRRPSCSHRRICSMHFWPLCDCVNTRIGGAGYSKLKLTRKCYLTL